MSLMLWQPKSGNERPLPREWVKKLIVKMIARYGTLFTDRYGGLSRDELADEWGQELAGYTGEELARGLDGLKGCKFPPTLPEFQALCRPPIDAEAAFHEALRNSRARERGENPAWSHPAIYWASAEIGSHDMRSTPYPNLKGRWERTLQAEINKGTWPAVPPAPLKLEAPPHTKPNPEVRAKLQALVEAMRSPKRKDTEDADPT